MFGTIKFTIKLTFHFLCLKMFTRVHNAFIDVGIYNIITKANCDLK